MEKDRHLRLANEHDVPTPTIEAPRSEDWGGQAEFTLPADTLLSAGIVSTLSKSFDGFDGIKPMFSMSGSTLDMSLVLDDNSQESYDKFREAIKQVIAILPDVRLEYADVTPLDRSHPIVEYFARRREEREFNKPLHFVSPID